MVKNSLTITKVIAYSGLLSATLISGKYVLSFIPNVEIVSALIILSSVFLGLKITLPSVVVFVLADTLIYGFYLNSLIQYIFHFPLLSLLSYLVTKKNQSLLKLILVSFTFSVLFWIETPIINVILRFSLFIPTLIAGIPFFIIQAISSIATIFFLYSPFKRRFSLINNNS